MKVKVLSASVVLPVIVAAPAPTTVRAPVVWLGRKKTLDSKVVSAAAIGPTGS